MDVSRPVRVFVSYSHRDAEHLEELLGYLRGLEREGVEFWTDREVAQGALWDVEIKKRIASADVALALVSQAFLDSQYVTDVEIAGFLERSTVLLPVILSPCEWRRHDWLASRQFLPGGEQTIEEHYVEPGPRKRLFLEVRSQLRQRVEELRAPGDGATVGNPFAETLAIRDAARFVGREAELRRLRELLDGGSVALVGEPKVGKSSFLWRLTEEWDGEVVGPIDLQAMEDREDFYEELRDLLGIGEGKRALRRALGKRRLLLILDELDSGSGRCLDGGDLGRFRALCGKNPGLKMVTVTRGAVKDSFPDGGKGSPAFNFLQPMRLGELTEEEARVLLAHPWAPGVRRLGEEAVEEILELAGLHPFQLQRAAFHRFAALGSRGSIGGRLGGWTWSTCFERGAALGLGAEAEEAAFAVESVGLPGARLLGLFLSTGDSVVRGGI